MYISFKEINVHIFNLQCNKDVNLNFIVTFNVMHLNYLNNESLEVHVTIN